MSPPAHAPDATVMIATHNRVGELRKTLSSLREQRGATFETVVVDDASPDGTADVVAAEFPEVTLVRFATNRGSVAARNEILRRARGEIVVGLDDDSRFTEPDGLARAVDRMRSEPDLGVLSFQPIGPEHPERLTDEGRLRGERHAASFAACGVALRRSLLDRFRAEDERRGRRGAKNSGPLPEFFFHMYEEPDLCLRVWDAGYRVLQWNELTVWHEYSGLNRNELKVHRRHARNEALSVLMRYPWPLAGPAALGKLAGQLRYALSRGPGWAAREPRVWAEVFALLPRAFGARRGVSARAVKIAVAVNRAPVADPAAAWRLGDLPWRDVLAGRLDAALAPHPAAANTVPPLKAAA